MAWRGGNEARTENLLVLSLSSFLCCTNTAPDIAMFDLIFGRRIHRSRFFLYKEFPENCATRL